MTKNTRKELIKTVDDENGNVVISSNNGERIILVLRLASETKGRKIGFININTKTFHVRRIYDKHFYRAENGYGFNYQILKNTKMFDKIRLSDEFSEWLIPVQYILDLKKFKKHSKIESGGFELQIFAPIHLIEQFKRKPKF